jgi:hypothetical protein
MFKKILIIAVIILLLGIFIYDEIPVNDFSINDNITYGISLHNLTSSNAVLINELGATWVRTDYNPTNPNFQNIVNNAESHNLHVLAIIDHFSVPSTFTYSEWNSTIREAVISYPDITAWEIWNEPDLSTSYYGMVNGSALQYFTLLKYAYQNIKLLAPNNIVIGLGGYNIPSNGTQLSWLLQLESYGAFNYMNAVSLHLSEPYINNQFLTSSQNNTIITNFYILAQSLINSIKTTTSLPIWITEAGAGSDQSYYINTLYSMFIKEGITHIFWYDLINDGKGSTPDYGLLSDNGNIITINSSYYDLQNFIKQNK